MANVRLATTARHASPTVSWVAARLPVPPAREPEAGRDGDVARLGREAGRQRGRRARRGRCQHVAVPSRHAEGDDQRDHHGGQHPDERHRGIHVQARVGLGPAGQPHGAQRREGDRDGDGADRPHDGDGGRRDQRHGTQGAGGEPGREEGPRLAGLVAEHPGEPEHQEEDGDDGHDDADGKDRGGLQPDGPVGDGAGDGVLARVHEHLGVGRRLGDLVPQLVLGGPRGDPQLHVLPALRVEVRGSGDVLAVVGGVEGGREHEVSGSEMEDIGGGPWGRHDVAGSPQHAGDR